MKDCIRVNFGRNQTHLKECILSEHDFPIETIEENGRISAVRYLYDGNNDLLDAFFDAIADMVIKGYEKKLLAYQIKAQYGAFKALLLHDVMVYIPDLEAQAALCLATRKKAVADGLRDYFNTHESAHIEGLLCFRFAHYHEILVKMAEQLLDLYFMHKEYEEFVSLLRYFVCVQDGRPELVHLIVRHHDMYRILSQDKEDITAKCISEFAPLDEVCAENFDDLLISILITLAPEKIIVHNSACIENHQLFETICKVFDKVEYCTDCVMCDNVKTQCK